MTALRRRVRAQLWPAGVVIAALLAVPLLNLVAPVVAIAFMVHLFEGLRREHGMAPGRGAVSTPGRVAARSLGNGNV